jgi:glycerol uptake facilitator-like aquaporin
MSATCIFIYGVLSSQYLLPPTPIPENYVPINNPIHSFFISCCLFLILCYSGQLTGGHCNPAVTLALLITKGNKITPLVFVVYALSQFAGALLGGLIAWPLVTNFNFESEADPNAPNFALLQLRILLGQIVGSFLYTLFVLIIMNDNTTFVKSTFWNYCLIPIVFYIIR